jgi:hypothetical protein
VSVLAASADGSGVFGIALESGAPEPTTVTLRAGNTEEDFDLLPSACGSPGTPVIRITTFRNGDDFTSGNLLYATASLTAEVTGADGKPINGATVTWSVAQADNNSPAMMSGWESKKSGLTWGATPEVSTTGKMAGGYLTFLELPQERITGSANPSQYNIDRSTTTTDGSGKTTQQLTDIIGEREITVEAKVSGVDYPATQLISFGNGPLSVFNEPVLNKTWDEAYKACNTTGYPGNDHSAASGWNNNDYVGGAYSNGVSTNAPSSGKMPTRAEYQAVSPYNGPSSWSKLYNFNDKAQGAAVAAGWSVGTYDFYWTGEAGSASAFCVDVYGGSDFGYNGSICNSYASVVACRR